MSQSNKNSKSTKKPSKNSLVERWAADKNGFAVNKKQSGGKKK